MEQERRRKMKNKLFYAIGLTSLAMLELPAVFANAQTIAPGPYYANPSWDQTLPSSTRFIVLSNFNSVAVLDRETGLVWKRSPTSAVRVSWSDAISDCEHETVANRLGWRLPSMQELMSLIDLTQSNPALPPDNPFEGIASFLGSVYWTSATVELDATLAKAIDFSSGSITLISKLPLPLSQGARAWCVRGGSSVSNPPY
jgi:Protein of unknown function (DUF1566)